MMFDLEPSALPNGYGDAILPLAAARAWVREDGTEHDAIITACRDIAISMVEQYTQLALGPRTGLIVRFDEFGDGMRIPIGPAANVDVTALSYVDAEGARIDMVAGDWRVRRGGVLAPGIGKSWPAGASDVAVTFSSGFPGALCPSALIAGVRLMTAHLYDRRDALLSEGIEGDVPTGVLVFCRPWRESSGL